MKKRKLGYEEQRVARHYPDPESSVRIAARIMDEKNARGSVPMGRVTEKQIREREQLEQLERAREVVRKLKRLNDGGGC
jgi:hypothetical protein